MMKMKRAETAKTHLTPVGQEASSPEMSSRLASSQPLSQKWTKELKTELKHEFKPEIERPSSFLFVSDAPVFLLRLLSLHHQLTVHLIIAAAPAINLFIYTNLSPYLFLLLVWSVTRLAPFST